MSIYSNVTEQDLINFRKLAEQQKEQRALKIKNRISKQTHDVKLAESLSTITKKLEEVNDSTQKVGDIMKESISEINNIQTKIKSLPKSTKFSILMEQMLGSLMNNHQSLKITQDKAGRANILDAPIQILGVDTIKINENICNSTPEIYKALSYTGYTGKTMKNENDILMLNNIRRDLGYTGVGDRDSKRKTFFTIKLPKLVDEIQNKTFNEID